MLSHSTPLDEINRHAIDLLMREIGVVATLRFMQQFSSGAGDYTKERDALFASLTFEQILDEIKAIKEAKKR